MPAHDSTANQSLSAAQRLRERRFPIICAIAIAVFMIVIGAIAASCGVPPLAIALTALTAGGITVWSVATDPVLHGDEPSSPGAQ